MQKEKNVSCTTVALHYRFVKYTAETGDVEIGFEVEPVRIIEISKQENDGNNKVDVETIDDFNRIETVDPKFLRSLDPLLWKEQDHYAVLGLKKLRYNATNDDVKRAYRKIVLKHHPDKRKAQGEEICALHDYFTCITNAYEILGTPVKRRSYDSVDPEFDNTIPSGKGLDKNFFQIFPRYFELNARWSEAKNVPLLGDENEVREKVEKFYNFWYNFDSWREYSYLDEEEKAKGQDRDERRWIEKQNKLVRAKRKKEEMIRIRNLVDLAYNNDPRISKFKQDDKDKKLAAKRAKEIAIQARKEEEIRLQKEAQEAKEREEAEKRAKIEAAKREHEIQKKALKKERKAFRDICKTNNYFCENIDENLTHMAAVEKLCELLKSVELETLNKDLNENGRDAFIAAMKQSEERIQKEREALLKAQQKISDEKLKAVSKPVGIEWTTNLIQLLIKAVNLYPIGVYERWDAISNYVNQHGNLPEGQGFKAKDVRTKAKEIQNTDFSKSSLKAATSQQSCSNFQKGKRNAKTGNDNQNSKKIDQTNSVKKTSKNKHNDKIDNNDKNDKNNKCNKNNKNNKNKNNENDKHDKHDKNDNIPTLNDTTENDNKTEDSTEIPWTLAEQQLLENALKTYPNTIPDRWEKIAEYIPNRSKKECMRRYKQLVEIVKFKKGAEAAQK